METTFLLKQVACRSSLFAAPSRLFSAPRTREIASWPFHPDFHRLSFLARLDDPLKLVPYTVRVRRAPNQAGALALALVLAQAGEA